MEGMRKDHADASSNGILNQAFLVNIANAAASVSESCTYTSVDFLMNTLHRNVIQRQFLRFRTKFCKFN